jgi:hypothetical protein
MHHCHYRHHNNSIQTKENKNKISLLQQQQQQQQQQNLSATKAQRWELWVLVQTAKLVVQNKKNSAPKKLNLLHNLCNLQTKQEKTKSGGATPKILTHICAFVICVGRLQMWVRC